MSKVLWFLIGLMVGDLWTGWLMHIVYVCIIAVLLASGHYPKFGC